MIEIKIKIRIKKEERHQTLIDELTPMIRVGLSFGKGA